MIYGDGMIWADVLKFIISRYSSLPIFPIPEEFITVAYEISVKAGCMTLTLGFLGTIEQGIATLFAWISLLSKLNVEIIEAFFIIFNFTDS